MSDSIKKYGIELTKNIISDGVTRCKPGSLVYMLYGDIPSTQSLNIKFGHVGEKISKKLIELNPDFELLSCGCRDIGNGIMKDFDLLWYNKNDGTIFYRELKANIELDTEKLPAMIDKIINCILPYLVKEYPEKKIDIGILHWSVYERSDLGKCCSSHIKKCESNEIKVEHMSDYMKLINFQWDKEDFYLYFKSLGKLFSSS